MSKQKTPADFLNKYAPPLEDQFFSLGYLVQLFDVNVNQVDVLMEQADVRFSRVQDGVMYVDGSAVEKMTEVYNAIIRDIEAATEGVRNS